MQLTDTLYVFTSATSRGDIKLVGKLVNAGGTGTFFYAPDYLQDADAFALDPINLPLTGTPYITTMNDGVFNVLLDSGPDKWGKHLMTRLMERPPRNNMELLLAASGGAGALHYSGSRKTESVKNHADNIYIEPETLVSYVNDIERSADQLPPFVRAAIHAGSSMGGARPKLLVRDKSGTEFIAKLNKDTDTFNVGRIELSMLHFAKLNGVRVPEARIQQLGGRDTLWVRRFDRGADGRHMHYISARSLLNGHRVRVGDEGKHISYAGIADIVRKISVEPKSDCLELFRRAAINIVVGNTDDHLKNHGFVLTSDGYRLSPAFDIVPQPNQTRLQAIGVGADRVSSLDALLTHSSAFYLTQDQAISEITSVVRSIEALPDILSANGVTVGDQGVIMKIVSEKVTTLTATVINAPEPENNAELKP